MGLLFIGESFEIQVELDDVIADGWHVAVEGAKLVYDGLVSIICVNVTFVYDNFYFIIIIIIFLM